MRKVVDFANVTVAVLTGLYLVLLTLFRTDGLKAVPSGLASSGTGVLCFFAGVFLVGINIRVLIREWKAGGFRRNLRITTDHGMSELSVSALEMLLLRDLRAEADIVEPGVILTPRGEGKPMLCEVELKLRRQEDVIKRMDSIKRRIRDEIDRLIPGGLTVEVLVEVRDFISEQTKSDRGNGSGTASEFNGPVYSDVAGSDGV
ncbi:MAG: alkaline shock response membrane anchor protein AmaP [Planctomycetes bacterium]|nr:alkaline shock response membrane anchor protein AmaP [Planctomycetota bacterium]